MLTHRTRSVDTMTEISRLLNDRERFSHQRPLGRRLDSSRKHWCEAPVQDERFVDPGRPGVGSSPSRVLREGLREAGTQQCRVWVTSRLGGSEGRNHAHATSLVHSMACRIVNGPETGQHVVWFHIHETSRRGKSTDRKRVCGCLGLGVGTRWTAKAHGGIFGVTECFKIGLW